MTPTTGRAALDSQGAAVDAPTPRLRNHVPDVRPGEPGAVPVPALLLQPMVELRNRVVHKGHLPTPRQAVGLVQAVFDLVFPLLKGMQAAYPVGMVATHVAAARSVIEEAPADATKLSTSHFVFPAFPKKAGTANQRCGGGGRSTAR